MPIPIEKLKAIKTIISHANCADGTASAILCKDVLLDAEVKFMQYGTKEHEMLLATEGMLFVDFTPPRSRVDEFVKAGAIVLDHHKQAEDIVKAFEYGVFADEKTDRGMSGALLAYWEVWLPLVDPKTIESGLIEQARTFATIIGVRDTWQRDSPDWTEACALAETLQFYPQESWTKYARPYNPDRITERMSIGQTLLVKKAQRVEDALKRAWKGTIESDGCIDVGKPCVRIVAFEGLDLASDAADSLGSEADLVVAFGHYFEEGLSRMVLTFRSHTFFDCGKLAKALGGGGHTKAAGATVMNASFPECSTPYEVVVEAIRRGTRWR